MPTTPEGIQTVLLHGLFGEPNATSTPLQGTLTFTPSPMMITFPTQNVIIAGTETVTLDANGEFTIELICTNTTGQIPDGWSYSVTEKFVGIKSRTYNIFLPYTIVTVELADITPTEAAPTYLPVIGPQGPPGYVNSVNGIHQVDITLTAANVGAVATSAVGAAGGVATLDGSSKVPVAQLPDLSGTYIPLTQKGAVSGVAPLDGSSKITSTYLTLSATAPPSVGVGDPGSSSTLARRDHTHDGVDLVTAQTVAGVKTFSSSVYVMGAGFGVGVSSGLAGVVDMRTASAGTTILNLQNTNGASTAALLKINGDTGASTLMVSLVTGDAVNRFAMRGSGQLEFGSGAAARDANFYRSGVGILNSSGQFAADAAAPLLAAHLTRKDYVDGKDALVLHLAGTETVTGAKTFTAVQQLQAAVSTVVQQHRVTADTNNRLQITSDGVMTWGPGNAAGDVTLYREIADCLSTDDNIRVWRPLTTNNALQLRVVGDTVSRLAVNADGKMVWGAGGASTGDTNLYRASAGLLTTDTALTVVGNFSAGNLNTGAWTTYTPTWGAVTTAPALGNGTIAGRYCIMGKTAHVRITLVTGSTTTFGTGAWTWTLPGAITPQDFSKIRNLGIASGNRSSGAAVASAFAWLNLSGTTVSAGPSLDATPWSATAPVTWVNTSTNTIDLFFTVELA